MIYVLEAYSTERSSRGDADVRHREYTRSADRALRFKEIPRINFTDSGHGVVFSCRELKPREKRKPVNLGMLDYVSEHMSLNTKKPKDPLLEIANALYKLRIALKRNGLQAPIALVLKDTDHYELEMKIQRSGDLTQSVPNLRRVQAPSEMVGIEIWSVRECRRKD